MVPEVRPGDLVHGTGKPSRGLPSTGLSYDWGQGEGKGKMLGLGRPSPEGVRPRTPASGLGRKDLSGCW
jgi:hypothetical protein